MLHLQVQRSAHNGHNAAVPQIKSRCIHEIKKNSEALGTDVCVQINNVRITLHLVSEDRVKQAAAGHEDRFVSPKMLSLYNNDNISQNIPASKAIEVQENIVCMSSELDAAVS